ncbi:MAG: threonine synthase [Flavobacteriales bacterium Tduv]
MLYKSLENPKHRVSFDQAVIRGLAPDKGLYFSEKIPLLPKEWIKHLYRYDIHTIALETIKPYVGDTIPEEALLSIIRETLHFPFPLQKIHDKIYSLELFHGPTLAFKDVGAKFMAGCLGYFRRESNEPITVLVATSGDTGGAVAQGFHRIAGVEVVILYPSGKVSLLQEKQFTTLGDNVTALEILGTFDDCQRLVKRAFLDEDLQKQYPLTSANSINVARWLPQMFYYFSAYQQLKEKNQEVVFSVPSGNFGNLCAGMMAKEMGLPVKHFIAATNINDTVPRFLKTGEYSPKKAHATLSNAMDVADPSNFARIWKMYEKNLSELCKKLSAYPFTDEETLNTIKDVQQKYGYILDPHGAVGYMGLQQYLQDSKDSRSIGIFLETAHPIKFIDKIPEALHKEVSRPECLKALLDKEKNAFTLANDYEEVKRWLLKNIASH